MIVKIKEVKADITKAPVDAIVNSIGYTLENTRAGVCGAIFKKAGPELNIALKKHSYINVSDVIVTDAYNLPSKYIFHTLSPMFSGGLSGDIEKLKACYTNCIQQGEKMSLKSIAFPYIGTGFYNFPLEFTKITIYNHLQTYFKNKSNSSIKIVYLCSL